MKQREEKVSNAHPTATKLKEQLGNNLEWRIASGKKETRRWVRAVLYSRAALYHLYAQCVPTQLHVLQRNITF